MTLVSPDYERYRFSVEDYHRMAEAGILGEDDRVELIDGEIITMSPIGYRHLDCVDALTKLLVEGVKDRAVVRAQGSVRLDNRTEPEPDLALLRLRAERSSKGKGPALTEDVHLLIEVMDSSASYDRGTKLGVYARAGIVQVWLVDLNKERVEDYTDPSPEGYKTMRIRTRGESVSLGAFPDLVFAVNDILQ